MLKKASKHLLRLNTANELLYSTAEQPTIDLIAIHSTGLNVIYCSRYLLFSHNREISEVNDSVIVDVAFKLKGGIGASILADFQLFKSRSNSL
jgi:hypothetical protein